MEFNTIEFSVFTLAIMIALGALAIYGWPAKSAAKTEARSTLIWISYGAAPSNERISMRVESASPGWGFPALLSFREEKVKDSDVQAFWDESMTHPIRTTLMTIYINEQKERCFLYSIGFSEEAYKAVFHVGG